MKKSMLVFVLVVAFTIFASSTAFAVVQEEPIELKEGEMGITSVEDEAVKDANQPVSNQPDDLKRTNEIVNQPDPSKTDEELSATSVPMDDATEEALASDGTPEMAQTGVVEDVKKDTNNNYLLIAGAILAVVGVVLFQRRSKSS